MSRLERAVEILEAINKHFECDQELSPYAQILEGDISIKDAIAECLGDSEEDSEEDIEKDIEIIPHSRRRKIWRNQWGNWNGYIGRRRVMQFGLNEEEARKWLDS